MSPRTRWLSRAHLGRAAGLVAALCTSACILPEALERDGAGGFGADGAGGGAGAGGHSACGVPPVLGATQVQTLTSDLHNNALLPSGGSTQQHLLATKRGWMFFYDDPSAPTQLSTRESTSFDQWGQGPPFDVTTAFAGTLSGLGRNFSVTARVLGGFEVFHISLSAGVGNPTALVHRDVRTRYDVQGGSFDLVPSNLDLGSVPNTAPLIDGPVSAFLSDDRVVDFSGRTLDSDALYGDAVTRVAAGSESAAPGPVTYEVPEFHGITSAGVRARAIVALPNGTALALWDDGGVLPTNLRSKHFDGAAWDPAWHESFANISSFDNDDWCPAANGEDVHVVAVRSGAFEHAVWHAGQWTAAPVPTPLQRNPGTGLLLVRDGPDSLWLFSLDANHAIHTSHWSPACDWSPWRQVVTSSTGVRTGLSGTHEVVPGATGPMVGLVWTLQPAIDQTFVEAAAITLPSGP